MLGITVPVTPSTIMLPASTTPPAIVVPTVVNAVPTPFCVGSNAAAAAAFVEAVFPIYYNNTRF
jgi:hypothetical protein